MNDASILSALPDVVYRLSPEGIITYVNEAINNYGYSSKELVGKHFSVLLDPQQVKEVSRDSVLPRFSGVMTGDERAPKLFDERRAGRRSTKCLEVGIVTRDGERVVVAEVMAAGQYAVRRKKQTFSGTVGTIRTAPGAGSGAALAEVNGAAGVVRSIDERGRFRRQREEQVVAGVGRLAGSAAHDLNNILSGMITLPQLLLNELSPNSPQRETIELILQSGRRAAALVDDMLTMSRCARASFEPLSWNRAVESYFCSGEYQHLLQQNPVVQIEHKLDGQLKLCSGAELHMSKILIHLVNNAVASIVGPGSVVVQTTQQYLPIPPDDTLGNSFSGDTVVVSISDSGCGIEIEDVNQIFEPFYMRKKFGRSGTGLELTLVRQCVLDMGGAIAVASKPGGGCTFKLYFPAARIIDMRPSPQRINAS